MSVALAVTSALPCGNCMGLGITQIPNVMILSAGLPNHAVREVRTLAEE